MMCTVLRILSYIPLRFSVLAVFVGADLDQIVVSVFSIYSHFEMAGPADKTVDVGSSLDED